MTRITANIILLTMVGVWAYLSIIYGLIQPVSDNYIYVAGLIAAGEFVAAGDIASLLRKKNGKRDESKPQEEI